MGKENKIHLSTVRQNSFKSLFTERNRGILLDIVVFLLNLFLMRYLTREFVTTLQWASAGEFIAQFVIFLVFLAVFILPPAGAVLKRWRFHERRRAAAGKNDETEDFTGGCLFNPILFFCLNAVIFCVINAFAFQFLTGGDISEHGGIFVSSILFGIVLIILQTVIVYRYFLPPKKTPNKFLRSPLAEKIGDACFFLNMIFFQLFWNIITTIPFNRVSGVGDFAGRLFFLSFIALLIYFPPRIFYLAEDLKRPRARLTMLLANSPVIFRVLIGTDSNSNW